MAKKKTQQKNNWILVGYWVFSKTMQPTNQKRRSNLTVYVVNKRTARLSFKIRLEVGESCKWYGTLRCACSVVTRKKENLSFAGTQELKIKNNFSKIVRTPWYTSCNSQIVSGDWERGSWRPSWVYLIHTLIRLRIQCLHLILNEILIFLADFHTFVLILDTRIWRYITRILMMTLFCWCCKVCK